MKYFLLFALCHFSSAAPNRRIGDSSNSNFGDDFADDYNSMEEIPESSTEKMRLSTIYADSGEETTTISLLDEDNNPDGMTFDDFVAYNLCKENIARLCFDDADKNGDDIVTPEELKNYKAESMSRAESLYSEFQKHNFELADLNGDDEISKNEAAQFAQNELKIIADAEFDRFFRNMDKNRDGMLDVDEFNDFLDKWYRNDANLHVNFNDYAETTTEMDTITLDESGEETPIEDE